MRSLFPLIILGIAMSGCLHIPQTNVPLAPNNDLTLEEHTISKQQLTIADSIEQAATGSVIHLYRTGTGSMRWTANDDAPVLRITLDYGCSYCKMFEEEVKPILFSTFVQQGKLQLEEIIIPMTNDGIAAAGLSLCTLDSLAWERLHAALFRSPTMSQATFVSIAKQHKVDSKKLQQCIKKNMMSLIKAQDVWAKENSIDHVPRSELLEESWIGLLDTPEMIERIEKILRNHKRGTMP